MGFGFWRRDSENNGHDWSRERISAFLDGELPANEASLLESHLATCPACRDEVQTLRATRQLLRSMPMALAPRSFALATAPRKAVPPRSFFYLRTATAAVAASFVVLLAVSAVGPLAGPAGSPAPAIQKQQEKSMPAAAPAAQPTPAPPSAQAAGGASRAATPQDNEKRATASATRPAAPAAAPAAAPSGAAAPAGAAVPAPVPTPSPAAVAAPKAPPSTGAPAAAFQGAPASPAPAQDEAPAVKSRENGADTATGTDAERGLRVPAFTATPASSEETMTALNVRETPVAGAPSTPEVNILGSLQLATAVLTAILAIASGLVWWRHRT